MLSLSIESKKFIAKADNITLGQLLDTWAEEELKTGTLSNCTVGTYLQAINRMKQFVEETNTDNGKVKPLSFEQYQKLTAQLGKRSKDAILPVQIAYFTGLRLEEVAGLTWQDISFEEQCPR